MNQPWDPRRDPWMIDPSAFCSSTSFRDRARHLLRYAILAPSSHNSQPWKFRLELDGIAVLRDVGQELPVADPVGREAVIGIGASLFNLRVAAAHFELGSEVRIQPHPQVPELLARVRLSEEIPVERDLERLFRAIPMRHTNRRPYAHEALQPREASRLATLPVGARSAIRIVRHRRLQSRLAVLVAQGDRLQLADPAYRDELASWVRPSHSTRDDGMPGDCLGVPDFASPLSAWFVRSLANGEIQGRNDAQLARDAPALAVVCSEDTVAGWIEAGELLERLLLEATEIGLQYGFLNQPVQVHDLRCELRELLDVALWPQVIVRLGHGKPVRRATPRRPLEQALLH